MDDRVPYVLNSASWFLLGTVVAAVWLRVYYHRLLRSDDRADREPPLAVFVAILVGIMAIVSALYSASTSLQQHQQGDHLAATQEQVRRLTLQNRALTERNNELATCTNRVLGQRQQVTDTPSLNKAIDALNGWAGNVLHLFDLPRNPTPAQQADEARTFQQQTLEFSRLLTEARAQLHENADYRRAHPLGRC